MTRRLLSALLGMSLLGAGVALPQGTCLAAPSAAPQWQAHCCCPADASMPSGCRTACELQAADQTPASPLSVPSNGTSFSGTAPQPAADGAVLAPAALTAVTPAAGSPYAPPKRYLLTHTFRL